MTTFSQPESKKLRKTVTRGFLRPLLVGFLRPLLAWVCVALSLAMPVAASADQHPKRLLVINSYGEGAPWAQEVYTPVLQEISAHKDIRVEVVHLNNTTIHNANDYDKMAAGLFARFAERQPDYLLMLGNFSFTLRDQIVKEWGDVPMLLVAMSDSYGPREFYYTRADEREDTVCGTRLEPLRGIRNDYNFTLVETPCLYKETVDMMVHMFPSMGKLVFLGDALYLNRHLSHEIRRYLADRYPDISYEWLMGSERTGRELQSYLNDRDMDTGLLFSAWFFVRTTIHGYPQLIAGEARLIAGCHRPVFGLRHAYLSYGLLGGCFVSPDQQGDYIHTALMEMLAGRDMRTVPFRVVDKHETVVNYRVLERDGLSARICPRGTVFINRPKTAWELYHAYIIAAVAVVIAAFAVAAVNLVSQRRKIHMLRSRSRLVESMPIAYSQSRVDYGTGGEVAGVTYHGGNKSFSELVAANSTSGGRGLFERPLVAEAVKRLSKEKSGTSRFSHHFDRTDTFYDFLVSVDQREEGKVKEVNVFALDMTDNRKKEAQLVEAREKALESERLKMAFLANMSHEIRTPLNAIVGFSDLISKTGDEERRKKYGSIIDANNQLLLKLIGDVLDVAKMESNTLEFNFRDTEINGLIENVESTMRLKMPEKVAFNCVYAFPECRVQTDPDRLAQVLVNLLSNAAKFTTKGNITLGYEPRGEEVYFYVRDTGCGIPPESAGRLFERFVKLDSFSQGNGLGLSISKSIVERLGGEIGVVSEGKGKGSLFWFTIVSGGKKEGNNNEKEKENESESGNDRQ